ncbi:hypothetical protein FKM82_028692 [Ascaphus truei]
MQGPPLYKHTLFPICRALRCINTPYSCAAVILPLTLLICNVLCFIFFKAVRHPGSGLPLTSITLMGGMTPYRTLPHGNLTPAVRTQAMKALKARALFFILLCIYYCLRLQRLVSN